jgi:hypothetical protein
MTSPPYPNKSKQKVPDYFGDYGCYVTSLVNIHNMIHDADVQPGAVNALIREAKGYRVLLLGKDCPIGQESYLVEPIIEKLLQLKISEPTVINAYTSDKHWVVRYPYINGIGHYANIRNLFDDKVLLFNTYNGRDEIISVKQVTFIREVSR